MRYHALKEEGIAMAQAWSSANKTLVTQRMKRSGMRWHRRRTGCSDLPRPDQIRPFERAWKALISATDTPANDNIPRAAAMAIAA